LECGGVPLGAALSTHHHARYEVTDVRITIDRDDRNSRRVVETVLDLVPWAEVRDARLDDDAADFLDRLVCCGQVTPVLEVGGLLLTAPTPPEAVLAVRRELPERVG
jgi:hypothetical protein